MKHAIAILMTLCLASISWGANELRIEYVTGATIVAAITNEAGQYWDTAGAAFETFNVLTDYDIAMTDAGGGSYRGTMPALPAGVYIIKYYSSSVHFATTTDFYWSGTASYDPAADAKTLLESATYGLSALKDIVEAILAIQSVFP